LNRAFLGWLCIVLDTILQIVESFENDGVRRVTHSIDGEKE
jgi:hypothetical protein